MSEGGGLAVEELPQGALQTVTHCLQWLLLLEVWREDALKVRSGQLNLIKIIIKKRKFKLN